MSGRVTTHTCIYTDPDLDSWSAEAILLYQYLFSNDHVNGLTGIGRISMRVVSSETRLAVGQIDAAKQAIGDRVRWFDDGSYWVIARAKHTCFSSDGKINPKRARGAYNFSCGQPEPIRRAFQDQYRPLMGHIWPTDDPLMGHRVPSALPTVTVTVTDTVKETNSSGKQPEGQAKHPEIPGEPIPLKLEAPKPEAQWPWLAPYRAAWEKCIGAPPAQAEMAQQFKHLHKKYPVEEVVEVLRFAAKSDKATFLTPKYFCQHFLAFRALMRSKRGGL